MIIKEIESTFSVCKINNIADANARGDFFFIAQTDEELSLVCETKDVPANALARDDGWRAFRIEGTLDFSLIGILSKISTLLAENEIGIFAVSTYNTDYILTKSENFKKALNVLKQGGYQIN